MSHLFYLSNSLVLQWVTHFTSSFLFYSGLLILLLIIYSLCSDSLNFLTSIWIAHPFYSKKQFTLSHSFYSEFRHAPRGKKGGVLRCPNSWLIFVALILLKKVFYFVTHFDLICALSPWNHDSKIALCNNLERIIFIIFPTAPTIVVSLLDIVEFKPC